MKKDSNQFKHFISKLSNKEYSTGIANDKIKFAEELKNANLTLEQYCDLYLKNIAHKKHARQLENNEHYLYKNIKLGLGTYEKIIVNDHYKCELCENFYAASKPSFISHIKRCHKISMFNYFKKIRYTEINPKPNELCGFCNKNEAEYDIIWNEKEKKFEKIYNGYFCNTKECKDAICQEYFGTSYEESKHKFEHIGAQTSFLCKMYKTTPEGLIKIGKSKRAKNPSHWKCNLKGFIQKYGIEEGTRRYKERSQRLSYTQKIEWFIEKYGKDEGPKKYLEKLNRMTSFHKNNKCITSRGERELYFLIQKVYNDAILEYPTKNGIIDIFIPSKSTVIEYYGDFWHCNPKYYKEDYINKILNMTAKEKQEFDANKNKKYLQNIENSKIAIIWESSFKLKKDNKDFLKPIILFIEKKDTVGSILWV